MSEATADLQLAIDRNAPAVLAVDVNGLSRLTRSRLLAGDETDGVWIALPFGQAEAVDAMIRTAASARVNVKVRNQHVEFHSPILERRRAFRLNAETYVEAIRLAWPTQTKMVQRRSAYRVGVAGEPDVRLRFWRIAPDADLTTLPSDECELDIDVRDLSIAGVGGIWKRRRGEDPVLPSDQRLRVDVITPTGTTTFDAYVRYLAGLPEPEFRRIGVQFMLNPASVVDRSKQAVLTKVTGDLQRAELKRLRVAR